MKNIDRKIEFAMYCVNKLNRNRLLLQQSIVTSIYNSSLFITEQKSEQHLNDSILSSDLRWLVKYVLVVKEIVRKVI